MRSWLVIFLWVLLPLQLSWAAAGQADAQGNGPVTAVHCSHLHCADSAPGTEAGANHADCGTTCHNAGSLALFNEPRRILASAAVLPPTDTAIPPASRPADLPERPQWAAVAAA